VSSIINKSKWIVTVKRRPDLNRAFPHYKGAEASTYKQQLLSEDKLVAEIARGPLKLFVRIRTRGRPSQYLRVHSYEEAEALDTTTRADQLRGVAVNSTAARRTTTAQLIEKYINEECVDHKGEDVEVWGLKGMLEDSRGELIRARQAFKDATDRGENPRPVKARRQARTALEWLHLPFEEVRSAHLTAFKNARLKQVKPATVNREMDLLSAVIHKAIDSWDYVIAKNPMKGAKRPIFDNGRDRRLEGDEQERLFCSARREDLIRSRALAIEALLIEPREQAKKARNKSEHQRFLKRARHRALKQLRRGYPIFPLYESLIAFLLESAPRRSEALALRWRDVNTEDGTAFFPVTKNSLSRTAPVQRFTMDLLNLLPRSDEQIFPLTLGEFRGAWERIAERAGLRERDRTNKQKCLKDFHVHDLRHEGLSRISEVGHATNPYFNVFDLQAISGHLDITSLARYINPKPKLLTRRLNASFAEAGISPDGGYRTNNARNRSTRSRGGPIGIVIAFPGVPHPHVRSSRAPSAVSNHPARGSAPVTKL
jgi:integrase